MSDTVKDKKSGLVASNRKALYDYSVEDTIEVGIVLQGSEVKSVRAHNVNLGEAYATIRGGEVWVINMRIAPYEQARDNADPTRDRKLLLTSREIRRLDRDIKEKGYTLIPLRMYFSSQGYVKIALGLCRGRRQYDKREVIAERDYERRKQRTLTEYAEEKKRK